MHYRTLHSTTLHFTAFKRSTLQLQPHLLYKLFYAGLHYTTLHYSILNVLHHRKFNCNHARLIVHTTSTTPLHCNDSCSCTRPRYIQQLQVTTATIATAPKNTAPTTFRSIRGFALPSVIHNNQALL